MSRWSELLYARPSFVEGMARILDFGNTLQEYNSSLTEEQADSLAVWSDWRAVGSDIQSVWEMVAADPVALAPNAEEEPTAR